jgi:3-phenylpropionate/trans-cinnamate dioxygenase ferredoxin reductase subunit
VVVAIARVVVVGAGLAGLRTVEELRARGYDGGITLIGAERRPPYDRPPLSKQLMTGAVEDTTLREDLHSLGADVRLGETAIGLGETEAGAGETAAGAGETAGGAGETAAGAAETGAGSRKAAAGPGGRVLRTDRGEYGFDALVLATGSLPIALPGTGRQRFLRTLDDALAIRALLRPGLRLVIVGAGWIGAELATAAAARGCQVTIVEAAQAPLAGALGAEVGALTEPWYEAAGVSLRLGQLVGSVQPGGLELADGSWLEADEIVTAVGVAPAVGWLASSCVQVNGGVVVDERLRSSVPGIYAVGDCAAFWSPRYGRRLRFEHWDIALRAPEVVAANLLGGAEVYDPVPYFWSEQFGRMVQYAGYHGGADRLVLRGDPGAGGGGAGGGGAGGGGAGSGGAGGGRWAACWLSGDQLVAALCVNSPPDLLQARRLIQAGARVDPERLADPAVPVRAAARS